MPIFAPYLPVATLQTSVTTYRVEHVAARYVLGLLTKSEDRHSMIPSNVVATVNDGKNTITYTGPKEGQVRARDAASQLDIEPVRFRYRVLLLVPSLSREYSLDSTTYNGDPVEIDDPTSGLQCSVRAQTGLMGRLELTLMMKQGTSAINWIMGGQPGEVLAIKDRQYWTSPSGTELAEAAKSQPHPDPSYPAAFGVLEKPTLVVEVDLIKSATESPRK